MSSPIGSKYCSRAIVVAPKSPDTISHLLSVRSNVPIMTSHIPTIEVLSGPERRRRWSTAEKLAIVQETYEPDVTVSIVARRHGIQPNQSLAWRKLAAQGALTASASQEEVVPASEYKALQNQAKEL